MELNIVLPKKKQYYIQNQNRNEKIEQLHVHPVEPICEKGSKMG